jgi:hypothetical protein
VPAAPPPPHRLAAWARRPALAVGLLGVAIAVSVAHGQPPPAARPSGVSVSLSKVSASPPQIGTVLLVTNGEVVTFDTRSRKPVRLAIPPGVQALRVWSVSGWYVALGRLPDFPPGVTPAADRPGPAARATVRSAAYLLRRGKPALPLGAAERVAPAADGSAVWLASGTVATRVALPTGRRQLTVHLPRAAELVADTPYGLVATTGTLPTGTPTPTPPRVPPTPATPTTDTPARGPTAPPTLPAKVPEPDGRRAGPGAATLTPAAAGQGGDLAGSVALPPPVPLTTLLVQTDGATRFLGEAQGLAAAGNVALVRRADLRVGVVLLDRIAPVRWLPELSAVAADGPAALDFTGRTFAVLARVNEHDRLMIGPTTARDESDINVVALDGGAPSENLAPPAFTVAGWALAPRPDGQIVYYHAGDRTAELLGRDLPAATAVAQG